MGMDKADEIAKRIQDNMKQTSKNSMQTERVGTSSTPQKNSPLLPANTQPSPVTFNSNKSTKPIVLNTFISWQLPIELCPGCMSRLNSKTPLLLRGWTSPAKDSFLVKNFSGKSKLKNKPNIKKDLIVKKEVIEQNLFDIESD